MNTSPSGPRWTRATKAHGPATGQTLRTRGGGGVRAPLAPPSPQPARSRYRAEEHIVRLRKTLANSGYDAGAATIAEHLTRHPAVTKVPAVATIWRILTRRRFVTPQPQKRPRSSWKRFEADLPNQCGKPTSPTGAWPITATSKSSTSSTTPPDGDRNRRRGFRPGGAVPRRRTRHVRAALPVAHRPRPSPVEVPSVSTRRTRPRGPLSTRCATRSGCPSGLADGPHGGEPS